MKKCAPEGRRRLRKSLAPLQDVQADMAGAEKRVVSEEAKVERQREEVCGAIQQSFEQLKAVLERRKAELVGKVSSLAQEKKNALAAQKTVLQVAQKEIQLFDGACGEERGEHERPGPDEHPQTTSEQDGGGRETPSTDVTGANSHCRHRLPPSLS